MCRLFADHGRFEIAGASADKPIAIRAEGLGGISPLARDDDQGVPAERLSADFARGRRAARLRALARQYLLQGHRRHGAHRARRSLELRDGRIQTYSEFFVPR